MFLTFKNKHVKKTVGKHINVSNVGKVGINYRLLLAYMFVISLKNYGMLFEYETRILDVRDFFIL